MLVKCDDPEWLRLHDDNTTPPSSPILTSLGPLEPDQLDHLLPKAAGRVDERGLVSVDDGPLPHEIGLVGLDHLRPLQQLPDDKQGRDEKLHRVLREEARHRPRQVARVPVHAGHHEQPHGRHVGAVRLEPARVGQFAAVHALRFARAVEEDVRHAHDEVVDESCVCESGEVSKYLCPGCRETHLKNVLFSGLFFPWGKKGGGDTKKTPTKKFWKGKRKREEGLSRGTRRG